MSLLVGPQSVIMFAIRTENLTKIFNGSKAVDSINLTIDKGITCGFLGPNGAGKTTTIGMMIGLIAPTSGKCFINDLDISKNSPGVKQNIGYLPDGVGFYKNLTGKQNLKYFSQFYTMGNTDARITELMGYVGLGRVDKQVGGYSRGMIQRLGLARVLLNDPDILFLDEPTNGLDPEGVIQFRKIIKEQSSKGKTIFFSSHIIGEVEHICDSVCIISKGRIMANGKLEEVRKKMRKDEYVTIIVKVNGAMPKLSHSQIIDITYNSDGAIIHAKSDIRDDISVEIARNQLNIRELRVEAESLEDIFLETVYRGDGNVT